MYCPTRIPCLLLLALLVASPAATALAKQLPLIPVDPADFSAPVDNPYFPMAFGCTYIYEVETDEGLVVNEITVTPCLVTILGVECTIIYDVEYLIVDGVPVKLEETFDFHAWDNHGNAWYFGEDTVEYIYDEMWNPLGCTTEGTWRAGADGAMAGIIMLADPEEGLSYYQEFAEGIAEDQAKVLRDDANVSTGLADFTAVVITKEWSPLSTGHNEQKFYAPGVGLVKILELKEKTVNVELVDIRKDIIDCAQLVEDFYLIFNLCD